jgi:hypothetical protein
MKPDNGSGETQKQEYQMTENVIAKRPSHTIYKVVGDGEDGRWIKVGVGFQHKDGHGVALMFDAIPIDGRIALRENREPVEADAPKTTIQLPDPKQSSLRLAMPEAA